MSYFRPETKAEMTDRLAELTGVAVCIVAMIYAINVAGAFALPPGVTAVLGTVQIVGGIVILSVYVPLMIWFKTRFSGVVVSPWSSDGFMGAVFKRAGFTTFSLLILFLSVLTLFSGNLLVQISAVALLDLVLAFAFSAFAVCVLVLARSGTEGGA